MPLIYKESLRTLLRYCLDPEIINSVFSGLSFNLLLFIHDLMSAVQAVTHVSAEEKDSGVVDFEISVSSAYL